MNVLLVDFRVPDKTPDEVHDFLEPLVPAFSDLPGLLAKVWIANGETGRYGAVYLWQDESALGDFLGSELWKAVGATPELTDITVRSFVCIEDFTKLTQPSLVVL